VDSLPGNDATTPARSRTSGYAIASLVLGIVGLVAVPFVASVLAIVFGGSARRSIAADPSLDGAELARVGVILGWVGVTLAAAGVIIGLLLLAALSPSPG
jgi:hypothetical protein